MTTTEFNDQFDILYNGVAGNDAPPLDLYEKSIYLTKAQLQLVKNYFTPEGNKYGKGFENSEKRRKDLGNLVVPYSTTLSISSTQGLSDDSQFFVLPADVMLIVQETAKVQSADACVNGKFISVVPKTHDEYNNQINNPFRLPDSSEVWRIDLTELNPGTKNVELISPYTITTYRCRYVKYPSPIILTDLTSAFPGEGLTIDGSSAEQTSLLVQSIHDEILDRAVELALADYKPENLQTKAQLNLRNE